MFSSGKMGGGGSGGASSSQIIHVSTLVSCKLTMVVIRRSGQEHNMGKRFLRCKGSPICSGFKWLDDEELDKRTEEKGKLKKPTKEEGKLKLCIDGLVKMQIEGNVFDVEELVKKLSLLK
ncbi:hypothetical protein IFM89_033667 [Coptis chinensis]|uniref:Zinc finger GRF-type domain-containing protein n=1 Tax=Coptis chinensis TaxID=261450 RepID=A0A835HEJ5_9MAGN|nr:hypothetical protein IFM89_033667 [Coptis chinensis]